MALLFAGLDIGKQHDYTALCVTELVDPNGATEADRLAIKLDRRRRGIPDEYTEPYQYHIRALERIDLKTPYPKQVDQVRAWLKALEGNDVEFVVDRGGVGDAVFDMFKGLGTYPTGIRLHGGVNDTSIPEGYNVSKRNLIAAAQVMLDNGLLVVNKRRPPRLWATCRAELEAYRVVISEDGHDAYANDPRQQPNDDLVIAVAMCCWYANKREEMVWRVV